MSETTAAAATTTKKATCPNAECGLPLKRSGGVYHCSECKFIACSREHAFTPDDECEECKDEFPSCTECFQDRLPSELTKCNVCKDALCEKCALKCFLSGSSVCDLRPNPIFCHSCLMDHGKECKHCGEPVCEREWRRNSKCCYICVYAPWKEERPFPAAQEISSTPPAKQPTLKRQRKVVD